MSGMTKKEFISTFDEFTKAYIEAALWSTTDESTPAGGEPLDSNYGVEDIVLKSLVLMAAQCRVFQLQNLKDIGDRRSQAGHDFWLTRNHHGAGFWETPDWPKDAGQRLTKAAEAFGECNLVVARGHIYQEGG
jgi:hypothetical protein